MKNVFNITKIEWLDKDTKEASVSFSFNGETYSFFSHPCDFKKGKVERIELSGLLFDESEPRLVADRDSKSFLIQSCKSDWSYEGTGKVVSLVPLVLDFNGLLVDLDGEIVNLEMKKGDFIELTIGRLDGCQI